MEANATDWLSLALLARPMWIVWMMVLFIAIAIYALRPRNKRHFDACAQIPFRADSEDRPHE